MTNADRIRNMTDEELANLVYYSLDFFSCDECEKPDRNNSCEGPCNEWVLKYLKKQVE